MRGEEALLRRVGGLLGVAKHAAADPSDQSSVVAVQRGQRIGGAALRLGCALERAQLDPFLDGTLICIARCEAAGFPSRRFFGRSGSLLRTSLPTKE